MSLPSRRTILQLAVATMAYPLLARAQTADQPPPQNSEALLVVYPDYPVNTDTFYGNTDNVGHAGVLLISASGLTRYYEFGRYPPDYPGVFTNRPTARGNTRNLSQIANAMLGPDGKATPASFGQILSSLSRRAGKDGRIRAAHFINMNFAAMESAARADQPDYDFFSFNCGSYAERVVVAGHPSVDRPIIFNPTPRNIVDEYIEEGNAEVLWNPGDAVATIGEGDETDAKR